MAFDQPLEADRVEDNLLVSLVRGPILGGLMWILGDDEEEKRQQELDLQQGLQDMVLEDVDDGDFDDENNNSNSHDDSDAALPSSSRPGKSLPRLVNSDLSAAMEISNHDEEEHLQQQQQQQQQQEHLHHFGRNILQGFGNVTKQKKNLSWSENLVEYMDESVRHEPPSVGSNGSSSSMSKPIKSAMTRSASIRSHPLASSGSGGGLAAGGGAGEDNKGERKLRYLPNGLDRAHNGLIMPTRPMGMMGHSHGHHANDPHGNGIESPQWGWYINTTPPTPEMYHSRSSLHRHTTDKSDHSSASTTTSATSALSSDLGTYEHSASAVRGPNRVFQGLKAGSNRPPVGWPSVPL